MLKIFIGYEPNEIVAFHTLVQSILEHASEPVSIIPLALKSLRTIHKRERDPRQSNDFTYTRFLVPHLCNFQGKALFMDCDMMFREDPVNLFKHADGKYAVQVVKHSYEPRDDVKYLGNRQYAYPRKNWSSVILWNCEHPSNQTLKPYMIDQAQPKVLHRFMWLKDEEIGSLPVKWNWLVGEYDITDDVTRGDIGNVHWTCGGPYFNEFKDADYADEWNKMLEKVNYCTQVEDMIDDVVTEAVKTR